MRPMEAADVPVAERISADAFHAVDLVTYQRGWPDPEPRPPERSARWVARTLRLLDTDAAGCWVAEFAERVVGFATSMARERLWLLATFAVRPGHQGAGVGARLLAAAESHGAAAGCDRAMLAASDDPRALRRYWRAGFALHPQLLLHGSVDRSALPAVTGLRDGADDDRAWLDDLDRERRGAPHGPDHVALGEMGRLVVAADRSGYAYLGSAGPVLVAARTDDTARRLLWEGLARAESVVEVEHVTTANPWALDVGHAAGLSVYVRGQLGVRGMPPPTLYVHNGALG